MVNLPKRVTMILLGFDGPLCEKNTFPYTDAPLATRSLVRDGEKLITWVKLMFARGRGYTESLGIR